MLSILFLEMPAVLSFAVFCLVFGSIFYMLKTERDDKAAPASYPIVGSLFSFLRNRSRLREYFTELMIEAPSNTIKFHRLGMRKAVITANPANVEHLLKTRFENYPKGDFFTLLLHDLLGNGIFNADGEVWKLQRRVASYEFSTRTLRDFIAETVEGEIIDRLLPLLRKSAATDKEGNRVVRLDMQDVLKRFAFDNICKVAFGTDPGCLDISLPASEFMEAFDTATDLIVKRFLHPLPFAWKVKRMLNVGSEKRLREAIRAVHNFAEGVIQTRKKEISVSGVPTHQDLLSRFLSLDESAMGTVEKGSYEDFVRDIVISFILAGRDTTSAALTWFFWLVSSHPHVEQHIDLEITRLIEGKKDQGTAGFSYEELKDMHYLHASLCESMRLYPPVPSDSKEALQDDVLPDGTTVSKGSRVTYHPYAMGRMESIWGADCLEFKPERWMKEDENGSLVFVAENAYKYPVFQAGPRICLGKEMAFTQMKCVAASVLREFSLEIEAEAGLKPKFVSTLTSGMEGGLQVKVVSKTKE